LGIAYKNEPRPELGVVDNVMARAGIHACTAGADCVKQVQLGLRMEQSHL